MTVFAQSSPKKTTAPPTPTVFDPKLEIDIPGLELSSPKDVLNSVEEDGKVTYLHIPFIGEYIAGVYRFSVAAGSVIAIVVIMVAGLQWTLSRGDSAAIGNAQKRIAASITGLLLLIGSYTVLYTINPELLNLRSLKVQYIVKDTDTLANQDGHDNNLTNKGRSGKGCDPKVDGIFCHYKKKGAPKIACPQTSYADNEACRKTCIEKLPPEKRSKAAHPNSSRYDTSILGSLDCGHVHGVRELKDITTVAIHEGHPNSWKTTWWAKQQQGQFPVGSHYFILQNGVVRQLMDERFEAGHGVRNAKSVGVDLWAGCRTFGLSHSQILEKCAYTDAQYAALRNFIRDLESRVSAAGGVSKLHIVGHCEEPGGSNHGDPRMFDWRKIGHSNADHKRGICAYVPEFELGKRQAIPIIKPDLQPSPDSGGGGIGPQPI